MYSLPPNTRVEFLNGEGLNCSRENLRLMHGKPELSPLPQELLKVRDEFGHETFLHKVGMAGMIADGHPNARLPEGGASGARPAESASTELVAYVWRASGKVASPARIGDKFPGGAVLTSGGRDERRRD